MRRSSFLVFVALSMAFIAPSSNAQSPTSTPRRIVVDDLGRLPTFSHSSIVGDLVFVSGTLGTKPGSLDLVPGGVGAETTQTLRNIETILEASGSSLEHVVKCNVYLADMATFDEMNRAYLEVFPENPPARTTTNSPALALGAAVEIECTAAMAAREASMHAPALPHRSGTLQNDGEEIYYEVTGQGPALVLSHGLGGNHAIWFQQVLPLAEHFQVITWDQRSFGRSTNRAGAAGPQAFASDLRALLDHLQIERAHLVGQSMGGWTTALFALENPGRTLSLVLADTPGGFVTPLVREDFARLARRDPAETFASPAEHPAIGQRLSARSPTHGFLYRQIASVGGDPDPSIARRLFAIDHTARAGALEMPALLVVGAEDQLFPPSTIREVAALLPNARVVEIPETGHSPYFENAEAWNREVLTFLQSREHPSARAAGAAHARSGRQRK